MPTIQFFSSITRMHNIITQSRNLILGEEFFFAHLYHPLHNRIPED
jgi:hypothetical protein